MTDSGTDYYLNIAGSSFVDGSTFHPLVIDNTQMKVVITQFIQNPKMERDIILQNN